MKYRDYYFWFVSAFLIAVAAVIEQRARILFVASAVLFFIGLLEWLISERYQQKKRKKKRGEI